MNQYLKNLFAAPEKINKIKIKLDCVVIRLNEICFFLKKVVAFFKKRNTIKNQK